MQIEQTDALKLAVTRPLVTRSCSVDSGVPPHLPTLGRSLSASAAKAEGALPSEVVVKIECWYTMPSYDMPWQGGGMHGQRSGTGFSIGGRRLVTNAHVVEMAALLQVQKQDDPRKFAARVACIAHDLDLAIVEVDDQAFWDGFEAYVVELDPHNFPELFAEVKVVGFPLGGDTVCVTKGIVSRVDAQVYAHAHQGLGIDVKSGLPPLPVVQIDSAINGGNSGGPAFDSHGRVVGVVSSGVSGAQNIGYVIPVSILRLFCDEYQQTRTWSGVSEMGVSTINLESSGLRAFLGLPESATGVLVDDVAPRSALRDVLRNGDIITHVDGLRVSNDGKVPLSLRGGHVVFVNLAVIAACKRRAMSTELSVLRCDDAGARVLTSVSAVCTPIAPLVPRFHEEGTLPAFVIIGGLVFTRLASPLIRELTTKNEELPIELCLRLKDALDAHKQDATDELVMLWHIMPHDVNEGCAKHRCSILSAVDEMPIKNLRALAEHYAKIIKDESAERFVRFRFTNLSKQKTSPDAVLERATLRAANSAICSTYSIPSLVSMDFAPLFDTDISRPGCSIC